MRIGSSRRAGGGGGTQLTPEDRLLRPALERALATAREELDAAPARLRPVLRFTKLRGAAWAQVREAVEQDPDFRAIVAGQADAESVGEAGMLWLERPDGWADRWAALVVAEAEAADDAAEERDSRRLRRALDGAEAARRRAEEQAAAAEQRAQRLAEGLAERQAAADTAEAQATELAAEVARLEAERARAVRSLKQLEAAHQRALEAAAAPTAPASPSAAAPPTPHPAAAPVPPAPAPVPAEAPPPPPPVSVPAVDLAAVAADVRAAAQAAAALAAALDSVAGRLGASGSAVRRRPRGGPPPARRMRRGPRSRRLPARLPPAVLEDSQEAADFLVRLPDALLLVDGYNVSKSAWPSRSLEEQRERLAVALDTLHARSGVDPLVVFDGVAEGGPPPGTVPISRATRVRFTAAGVEADDVLLDLVDDLPTGRAVIVASSDRRVQEGARARGANVLSAAQLLGLLRR